MRLEERAAKLRELIEKSYEDKLEGRISEDFWETKTKAWKGELATIERKLCGDGDSGGDPAAAFRALELAKNVPALWVTKNRVERRRIRRNRIFELDSRRRKAMREMEKAVRPDRRTALR